MACFRLLSLGALVGVSAQDVFLAKTTDSCGPSAEVASRTVSNQGKFAVWDISLQALLWVDSPAFTPAWSGSVVYGFRPSDGQTFEIMRFETASVGFVLPRWGGGVMLGISRPNGDGSYASSFESLDVDTVTLKGSNLQHRASLPGDTKGKINNGKCDPEGRLWAGTFDYGKEQEQSAKVWVLNEHYDLNVAMDGLSHPNGYVFTDDGGDRKLLLSETFRNVVYEFEYSSESTTLGTPKVLVQGRAGEELIDSICGLADGSFFATNPDPIGKLVRYSAAGEAMCETTVDVPNSHFVASCAFIGEDMFVPSGRNGGSESGPDGWLYRFNGMGKGEDVHVCRV
jgi:sugar lactone lactonase YvrE